MNDYESACGHFTKAMKLKGDDNVCLIWLGVSLLFHAVQMSSKLDHMTSKSDSAYKALVS